MNKKQKFARAYLQPEHGKQVAKDSHPAFTELDRACKDALKLEKLLRSMPKKLNVKPEPTYKPNHNLQNL